MKKLLLLLSIALTTAFHTILAQAVLVKDINPGSGSSSLSWLTDLSGTLFFHANDGTNGSEPWISDGTSGGTVLVKDINVGIGNSALSNVANIYGFLFFQANDGTHGKELWRSDGTSAGTVLVKDITTGSGNSSPVYLAIVNSTLFFAANDGTNGYELWKSDGTSAGTVLVKDIYPGATGGLASAPYFTNVNGTLFFVALSANGFELWKSDGTAAGTVLVKDINTGGNSNPDNLTNVNGTLFFAANDGVNGRELWKSDGTTAGTVLVKNIYPAGTNSSDPDHLVNINGTLFFHATNGTNGYELWKSDGTSVGTVLVKDIEPGLSSSSPAFLTNVNGTLFFAANDGTHGGELWKSDGTSIGTVLVKDINPGSNDSDPRGFINIAGVLYFRADNGTQGIELWKSDGTSIGTTLTEDINPGVNSSNPGFFANVSGTLFFSADDGTNGAELWKIDNSIIPNSIVTNSISGSSFVQNSSVSVPYTASGTFNTGNIFSAELSNTSGSFASPVTIGTLASTSSDTITATIPANTPIGTGYRIRVVSDNPIVTGSDNGFNIEIQSCDDNNPCTDDTFINGVCSNINNTSACNDVNACTENDVCTNAVCAGTPIVCDDFNPSTTDYCLNGSCVFASMNTWTSLPDFGTAYSAEFDFKVYDNWPRIATSNPAAIQFYDGSIWRFYCNSGSTIPGSGAIGYCLGASGSCGGGQVRMAGKSFGGLHCVATSQSSAIQAYSNCSWVSSASGFPSWRIALTDNDGLMSIGLNQFNEIVVKSGFAGWSQKGNPIPGYNAGTKYDIVRGRNGKPYIFFTSGINLVVYTYQYNGFDFDWTQVGDTAASLYFDPITVQLEVDKNGVPFIAYSTSGQNKVRVRKFNGSSWVPVGTDVFSGSVSDISLVVDFNGAPYVSYKDVALGKPVIKKFDGNSWVDLNVSGSFPSITAPMKLASGDDNILYAAYADGINPYTVRVIKYSPPSASITTNSISGSSFCSGSFINIPFTASGTFTAGNIFAAQLSNSSGSFTSPVNIGSLTSTASGTINATIPANTPAGTGYRIRAVSSNPAIVGNDNGSNLTILSHTAFSQNVSICEGDSFFVGGSTKTVSGTYFDTLVAFNGCDSIVTINLTVLPSANFTFYVDICEGDSFFAGGSFQTASGIYYDTLLAFNFCDSFVTTNLTVLPSANFTQDVSICAGDSLFAGGSFQTASGTYLDTLAAFNGCDSVITTNLTIVAVCDDGNLCTNDICSNGQCEFQPLVGCVTFSADHVTSTPGAEVLVPIRATNFSNMLIMQGSLEFDESVLSFMDVVQFGLPGMTIGNFGTAQSANGIVAFAWDDATLTGVSVADSTVIFALKFSVTGTPGQQSSVDFSIAITALEFYDAGFNEIQPALISGSVTIPATATISGICLSELGAVVPKVTFQLTGSNSQTLTTDTSGQYAFTENVGGGYTITPSKNNDSLETNGVTTLDISLIRRHILGNTLLSSPYKIIAADVNGSNSVTTLDIAVLRRLILGIDTSFNGKLWSFVPSDYLFTNPLNPFPYDKVRNYTNLSANQTNQNFIGIKLGDVNGSWNPNILKMGSVGEVRFLMDEYQTLPGDEIIVPVRVKDFNDIAGYQFTTSWNPEVIQLLEVVNQSIPGYYGEQSISDGMLTTSWNDGSGGAVSLDDDAIAFELKFKVIGALGSSTEIKIGSEITVSEAYTDALDLLDITATHGSVKVGEVLSSVSPLPSQVYQLSVAPNPFTNSTNIIFTIPQDEQVNIKIYDMLGKVVKTFEGNYPSGKHKSEWAGTDETGIPLGAGLYHVRMMAGSKMLNVKASLAR